MDESDTLQAKRNTRQDDPGSPFLLLQRPFNTCCWVYAAVPSTTAQLSKASFEENQWQPGPQHKPPHSATQGMSTLLYAAGCDGIGTERNATVRVPNTNLRA